MNSFFPPYLKTLQKNLTFPLFLTEINKYPFAIILWSFATILYLVSNHFPLFPPRYLPMWWIDEMTPFIPFSVWIYVSEYLFFVAVYMSCKDLINLNKYFYAFFFLQLSSVLIFWIWPTTYPRELFPLTTQIDPMTYWIFYILRQVDTAANCCPSLHVSSVYLSTFIFLNDQREKFPFFFLWGTAIAISTLTTKQHYLVDILWGIIMAITYYIIFFKYIAYRQISFSKISVNFKKN